MALFRTTLFLAFVFLFTVSAAFAEVTETRIEYKAGEATLVGFFYSDPTVTTSAPAVLIFSDWSGIGEFAKDRAKEFAGRGYRAFVADVYGEGKSIATSNEALEISSRFGADRPMTRERAKAGYYTLLKQPGVESKQIAAIGFSFGGMVALELARSGAPVAATVAFHAPLNTPNITLANNITGRVLVFHGANDPYVTEAELRGFAAEMRGAPNLVWELVEYGGAVHSFTNPAVGTDPKNGAAYNEPVTKRAYRAMNDFFTEIFGR